MARWQASVAVALFGATLAIAGEPKNVVLDVPGMDCSLCPITVRKALERVPGVLEARAFWPDRRAEVKYDPDRVTPAALAAALANTGYPATVRTAK